MSEFDERKIKIQPTCLTCKYHREYGNEYFDDMDIYCLLGASFWETRYVDLMERDGQDRDAIYDKIMKITTDDEGAVVGCDRLLPHNSICQFYEEEKDE